MRAFSWPHILSFSRIVAGPVVAALVLAPPGDSYLFAGVLFGLASVTDLLDGKLARHSQRASALGVFLDTTSDKILVCLAIIALALAGLAPAWMALVITGREFLISGLRSYAATCGRIISAHSWGKGKAAVTMVATVLLLLAADGRYRGALSNIGSHSSWSTAFTATRWLLGLATVMTVVSGSRYLVDARRLLLPPRREEAAAEHPRIVAGGGPGR